MSVAFNGIDNQVVTFQTGTTAAGNPVVMSANNTVKNAAGGAAPRWQAQSHRPETVPPPAPGTVTSQEPRHSRWKSE